MPQVNPSLRPDHIAETKSGTIPRTSAEKGFNRELEDEVHKLSDSASPQPCPARNITVSGDWSSDDAQRNDFGSNLCPTQCVKQDAPAPLHFRPPIHPATLEEKGLADNQSEDTDLGSPSEDSGTAGNSAASNVLAALAVLLFSSVDPTRQNLPTEVPDLKQNGKPVETFSELPQLTSGITIPVDEKGARDTEPASLLATTVQQTANPRSLPTRRVLLSDLASLPDMAAALLKEPTADAAPFDPTGTATNRAEEMIGESLDAQGADSVFKESIEVHSRIAFEKRANTIDSLLNGPDGDSKTETSSSLSTATDPTENESTGQPNQLIQDDIGKILASVISRDAAQTKATTTPRILAQSRETDQTDSFLSVAKQAADTKSNKETPASTLSLRWTGLQQDSDHQADQIILTTAQVEVKEPTVENRIDSFSKVEANNLRRELPRAKDDTPGDIEESSSSVARESLHGRATNLHQQLGNRREETSSGQVTAQTDRVSRTELPSRPFTKDGGLAMPKQGEELGAPSLTAIGHATLSAVDSGGSDMERSVPVASNGLEEVEKANVISQLVEKAHLIAGRNDGELVISLKPEFLGRISLRASMVEKTLVATLVAESSHVRDLLESQLPLLQHSLKEQGLPVAKVVVLQGNELSFSDASKGQPNFQQNPESRQAVPHFYRHTDSLQETEEPEMSSISPIPHRPYNSRSINLIA